MSNSQIPQTNTDERSSFITSGSISKAVWYLAWPTAVHSIIQTAYMIINPMFLGHMKRGVEESLAAATVSRPTLMLQFAVIFGISVGASALVARSIGAKQPEDANEAAKQSLILCVILGILTTFPIIVFAEPIARLVGARPDSVRLTADYTAIIAYSSVPAFIAMTITAILRSAGDVIRPLIAGGVTTAVNILFDWLLIHGNGPFPEMGLNGAAIATGISRVLGTVLLLYFLRKSILRDSLSHFNIKIDWFRRILNIGIPAAMQNLLFTLNYTAYVWLLGYLPNAVAAQASLGPSFALEGIAYMPGGAYSAAATALVGQNLGAGNIRRAERSAMVACMQAAVLMSVMGLVFFFFPEPLARAFISEDQKASSAAIVPLIVSYLRINAFSEPLFAIGMTLRGALQGAGDVRVPTIITAIALWGVRIPMTWLLALHFNMGVTGAWIAMSFTTGLSGLLTFIWFKHGAWKSQQI